MAAYLLLTISAFTAQALLEIPRDRDIVLYCTCPNEITSAREALRLRARGMRRVRPLEGGFAAWRACDLPVDFIGPLVPPGHRILNAP